MKITVDRKMTDSWMMERTKEQAKAFKEGYTDGDLLRMFREAIDDAALGYNYDIIRCNLSAFPGGTHETDETHYAVEMLLEGFDEYIRIRFYISQSGDVDTRTIRNYGLEPTCMYEIKRFKLA